MGRRGRSEWRHVDGVLLFDKPAGQSSNAALQAVRGLYRAEKAGHAGTLDPLATGLLPILFGEATKFGGALLAADKTYAAEIALGTTTTTGDAEGVIVERRPVAVTMDQAAKVVADFLGPIAQVPPMYSALKRDGRPLYAYARAGAAIERAPRTVTIHELRVTALEESRLQIEVRCGKGTYIRVLAEDIGRALGCGAHIARLRRLAVAEFGIHEAIPYADLAQLSPAARDLRLQPVDTMVRALPAVTLDAERAVRFSCGQTLDVAAGAPSCVRVYRVGGVFLGTGTIDAAAKLRPLRLLRSAAGVRDDAAEPCESR